MDDDFASIISIVVIFGLTALLTTNVGMPIWKAILLSTLAAFLAVLAVWGLAETVKRLSKGKRG